MPLWNTGTDDRMYWSRQKRKEIESGSGTKQYKNQVIFMWTLRTSADGFPFVEEIIDVSATLVMEPENGPQGLHLPLSLMRLSFSLQDTNPWILLTRYKLSQHLNG